MMPLQRMMPILIAVALLVAGLISEGAVFAQEDSSTTDRNDPQWLLPLPELQINESIPTTKQVLRYEWGQDISSHHQIETYLKALAKAAPERTLLVQYGESSEGRSLNYLVISSAENIARIDEIKAANKQLGAAHSTDAESARALIENAPAIVWMAYAVHGNEISPSDAALLTAYHLLADERDITKEVLNNLVVVIDPLQNPDGRDRFVNVFRETRGKFMQANPMANEHTERWPSGRSNHYWFDMNRDWFRHSQKEVKAKVAAYLDWQPQIYVDAHEMGANSSYYFPPPTDPKNPFLLESQHEWFSRMGKHQAGWFDKYGFGYMTREVFDAFYPGYGSEWPTLQGGLGILWEQASARGQVVDRNDETRLTYQDGVRNHYVSGIATVEFAAANRKQLLDSYRVAREGAVKLGTEGPVKHYFLGNDQPHRSKELMSLLQRNGIEVNRLNKSIRATVTNIAGDESTRTIPAGSFHVSVAQPGGRLLRALFDRKVEMDEKFLRRQLERNQLRLPDEIYDVTAWSLPLAFGVDCLASADLLPVESSPWDGKIALELPELAQPKVAYLVPPTDGAVQMMSRLLQDGVRVHVTDKAFTVNDRDYEAGTLIVKVSGNDSATLHSKMIEARSLFHVQVDVTDTAYVQKGAHMGGPNVHWVKPPKILIVVNRPTNYSSGHTWYLFDEVLNYPTTRVKGSDFGRTDLTKFNTIVLPDGGYSSSNGFGEGTAKKLGDWVAAGGTLVTLRGGTEWAVSEDVGLLKNKVLKRKSPIAKKSTDEKEAEPKDVTPDNVPGAFFKAGVFGKHWVTFGYKPDLDVFYSGRLVLGPTSETDGRSLVTFGKREELLSSGFCWPASLDLLAETPYAVYRSRGAGHVIGFVDDPNFRAMYPSLQRLFINATMFGAGH